MVRSPLIPEHLLVPSNPIGLRQNDQWTESDASSYLTIDKARAGVSRLCVPSNDFYARIFMARSPSQNDFQYCMSRKLIYLSS